METPSSSDTLTLGKKTLNSEHFAAPPKPNTPLPHVTHCDFFDEAADGIPALVYPWTLFLKDFLVHLSPAIAITMSCLFIDLLIGF